MKVLPLFPEAFEHCSNHVELILQFRAFLGAQESFIPAHFEPQFTFIARADGHLEVSLELRGG